MSDLIDRQAVIDALEKWFNGVFGIKESDGTTTIFKRIRELPTVEPKKGRWEETNIKMYYVCSECKQAVKIPKYVGGFLYDFCPNCGARMDGDTDG